MDCVVNEPDEGDAAAAAQKAADYILNNQANTEEEYQTIKYLI